jgi:hypothetical protein
VREQATHYAPLTAVLSALETQARARPADTGRAGSTSIVGARALRAPTTIIVTPIRPWGLQNAFNPGNIRFEITMRWICPVPSKMS